MSKYTRLFQRLVEDSIIPHEAIRVPAAVTDEEILRVHNPGYLEALKDGSLERLAIRRIGFPWSDELLERSRLSCGGTLEAARRALTHGVGVNLAGGTHHAFPDFGQGYCVLNDCAIAVRALLAEKHIQNALILDLDVHQGNGTAAIFAEQAEVFTFSMHGARLFPHRKEKSDLDIPLEDGLGDMDYLERLYGSLPKVLEQFQPELVCYLAGADPYIHDRIGSLSLSKQGLAERDHFVLTSCRKYEIPVAVVMSGGYARCIDDIVDIHAKTIQIASSLYAESEKDHF